MIEKIISGGQTGADIAGLIVAKNFGLETGGWMPKGFLTQAGPKPEWAEMFDLKEHSSPRYPPRTFDNVFEADGTIRLAYNFDSPGEICTLKAIKQSKKPHFDVDLNAPPQPIEVINWINHHSIKILNVAGNSEHTYVGTAGEVMDYLPKVLIGLGLEAK